VRRRPEISTMRRARRAIVLLTAALLVVTAGCTSEDDRPEGTSDADTMQRGTLRIAIPNSSEGVYVNMDPQRSYIGGEWEFFRCCLLRTLYSYSGKPTEEGGGEPRPDLAVGSPVVSADGLTWRFRLKRGLHYAPPFEDTPIVALDVVRALERTARVTSEEEEIGYPFYYSAIKGFDEFDAGEADSIAGLETPHDLTLVVRLERVTGDLAYRFAMPATAPIPEEAVDGHDEDYGRVVVASGPYMIEGSEELDFSVSPDEQEPAGGFVPAVLTEDGAVQEPGSLLLVRNPSWDPNTDRLRAAYADQIEVTIGGLEEEEIARRVDTAQVDFAFARSAPFDQVARYQDDPALEGRVFLHSDNAFYSATMNLAVPPFDDVHVRRAVALAIDRAALVELLSEPPYGPFGQSWGEVATHMATDAFEGRLLRSFDPYPYDPVAAREEMRASAYDRTGDGRCDAAVCRNVRALVMDEGVLLDQARAIQVDLAEVGIELELDPVPWFEFFGDKDLDPIPGGSIHDPSAQIPMGIAYPWGQDYPEGGGWFSLFDSSLLEPLAWNTSLLGASPAELREWGYRVTSVPSVDDRIEDCLERRGVGRTQCWAELDQYLTTEVVSRVPIFFLQSVQVVSERVVGYSFDQFTGLPALDRIALAPGSE
jgi:peptide/nickel transport system substrate-binding protein